MAITLPILLFYVVPGVEVRIACPKGYEPNPLVIKKALEYKE